jgi:hypothetical protein
VEIPRSPEYCSIKLTTARVTDACGLGTAGIIAAKAPNSLSPTDSLIYLSVAANTNQFIISYLSGLCRRASLVVMKHLGMAYVSLFLILFRILMTRHLQLPAGQIQCFLIYILFPCEFHYFEYGACKLSKFLILYKILMTQHLRLPTGQIQCLPTYSLSPCELHYISNTRSDLTVVWQPLQVQLIFRSDAMASATEIQTYNSCNTCRFWRCTMHFVCTDHLMCLAGEQRGRVLFVSRPRD